MSSARLFFVCAAPILGIILSISLFEQTVVEKLWSSFGSLSSVSISDREIRNKADVKRYQHLSLQQFYDEYDGKWPVIVTNIINPSQAVEWTATYLLQNYGEEKVVLKRVKGELESAYSSAVQLKTLYNELQSAHPDDWAYVEDELFISTRSDLAGNVPLPVFCDENFFTLFPEEVRPWDSMMLWGSKYSRSSLHIDPYNWTGTNLVLWGHKHWKMYPPGNDHLLYVAGGQQAGFPLPTFKYNSPIDASSPDYDRFPLFREAEAIEFDQYAGDMLFIPSGWFHQAFNMEETLAISGQLMNRNNWHIVLEEVLKASPDLRSQLPDDINTRTPVEQVQAVLDRIPADVLEKGRQLTANILAQIHSE